MAVYSADKSIKFIATVTFLLMVAINALANALPINGVGTGEVSDSYANLFAPTGLTFAIWGLIYLLLAAYTFFQLDLFQDYRSSLKTGILDKIGLLFSLSSLANSAWIFAWHYQLIPLSMVLMVVILVCLILIVAAINKQRLTLPEYIFLRLPFSVYFGWITAATIANATVLLVSLEWEGFGISEPVWTVLILLVGLIIGAVTTVKNRDIAYGLVIIWAYAGILFKHISAAGFDGQYPAVIYTVIACLVVMAVTEGYTLAKKKRILT